MKLTNRQLLAIIGVLSFIIIGGAIYIGIQNTRELDPVYVETFSPEGQVKPHGNFTVAFSRPVVDNTVINQDLDEIPVKFTPQIPGKFRWIALNTLRFFPIVSLSPSTEYAADVSPTIPSSPNFTITGKRKFTFFTERFQVRSSRLAFEYSTKKRAMRRLSARSNSTIVSAPYR